AANPHEMSLKPSYLNWPFTFDQAPFRSMSRRCLLTDSFQLNIASRALEHPPKNIDKHDYGISDYASFTAR
ncbi:hypothetical protein, partial [Corynebacterium sp. HMSC074A09]|uniref:hypothetical protein n=1 Tax=Corynebacterium sp. HMSC074A09 TaxID=1739311 RepID=UPI001E5F9C27